MYYEILVNLEFLPILALQAAEDHVKSSQP